MSDLNPYEEGLALELQEAKGRIKALQKALKDQSSVSDRLAEKLYKAEAKLAECEARLGKAVDALRAFNSFDDLPTEVQRPDIFEINVRLPILRALAELTGGKDE